MISNKLPYLESQPYTIPTEHTIVKLRKFPINLQARGEKFTCSLQLFSKLLDLQKVILADWKVS